MLSYFISTDFGEDYLYDRVRPTVSLGLIIINRLEFSLARTHTYTVNHTHILY